MDLNVVETILIKTVSSIVATSIPEITSIIASHLTKKEIASCALVCRTWSSTYTPLLWKHLKARIPTLENSSILPDLFAKNGHYIRILEIADLPETYAAKIDRSPELVYDCPAIQNVVHLTIHTKRERKHAMRNIIHHNRHTVRYIWLSFQIGVSGLEEPWLGFPDLAPCLHSLFLENWMMTRQELILILKACPGLKLLSLDQTLLDQESSPSSSQPPPSALIDSTDGESSLLDKADNKLETKEKFQHLGVKCFRLGALFHQVLDLIPNVEILDFQLFKQKGNALGLDRFCQAIKEHCKRLDTIWVYCSNFTVLPAILESLSQLVTYNGYCDMEIVTSMLDHAETVKEVNLPDYIRKTPMPLKFLEICPRLECFVAGQSSSTTISEVQESLKHGWACTNLQVLLLVIDKLSFALAEVIMQELGAKREVTARENYQSKSQIWITAQLRDRRKIQADIDALMPEQLEFRDEFSEFLKGMQHLTRLNLGSGWYTIFRPTTTTSTYPRSIDMIRRTL